MLKINTHLKSIGESDFTLFSGQPDYCWVHRILKYLDKDDKIFKVFNTGLEATLQCNGVLNEKYFYYLN